MKANPSVYRLFVRFCRDMAAKRRKFGIGLVAERVRWEMAFKYDEDYKINNNYRAYIARRIIANHPEVRGYLTLRKTKW